MLPISQLASSLTSDQYRLESLPPAGWYIPNFITEQEEEYLLQKIAETPKPRWKTVGTGRRLQYLGGSLTKKNALIPEPLPAWVTSFPDLIDRISRITDVFQCFPDPFRKEHNDTSAAQVEAGGSAAAHIVDKGKVETQIKANGARETSRAEPNQLLINEYQAGQGISPHEDGPAYHPAVATISLGSSQTLDIFQYLSHTTPSPPLTASASPNTDRPFSKSGYVSSPLAPNKEPLTPSSVTQPFDESGKPIATVPMARLYLEPRSLFIMSSALYRTHLHGIPTTSMDTISAPQSDQGDAEPNSDVNGESRSSLDRDTDISNARLLGNEGLKQALLRGDVVDRERSTRTSLTFRRVDKVVNVGLLGRGMGIGKLGTR